MTDGVVPSDFIKDNRVGENSGVVDNEVEGEISKDDELDDDVLDAYLASVEQQVLPAENLGEDEILGDGSDGDNGEDSDDSELESGEEDDEYSEVDEDTVNEVGLDNDVVLDDEHGSDSDDPDFEVGYVSDELHSVHSSDDEIGQRRDRRKMPEFNTNTEMHDVVFELGMIFTSLDEFKQAIMDYAVANGREIRVDRNDKKRCQVKCKEGCPFRIWCSKIGGEETYQIKTFVNRHNCSRTFIVKQASTRWLAGKILPKVRGEPRVKSIDLVLWIKDNLSIQVNRTHAFRAKRIAQEMIDGTHKEQYLRLRDYGSEVHRSNPGSSCFLNIVDRPTPDTPAVFKRIYICLDALKRGFRAGCRPLIGLDGCFLKGMYGGHLLTAVSQDGNNVIFPIAWAVVGKEDGESWTWFLNRLIEDIGPVEENRWSFMSDRQKGLVPALQRLGARIEHRFCVRHIYNNFSKRFKGLQYKRQLYKCAKATTHQEFQLEIEKMRNLNEAAYIWLHDITPNVWCKAFFMTHSKNDAILNNMSESYNAKILEYRDKPIITLLEELRLEAMNRHVKLRRKMSRYHGRIVPKVAAKLEIERASSAYWTAHWPGDNDHSVFQVTKRPDQFVVNLRDRSCSWRVFDLTGIPCCHAMAAIGYVQRQAEDFVNDCYTKEAYMSAYEFSVMPTNGTTLWPRVGGDPILPPKHSNAPGRAKKRRRRDTDEPITPSNLRRRYPVVKCTKCGVQGHNRRTCNGPDRREQTNAHTQSSQTPVGRGASTSHPLGPTRCAPVRNKLWARRAVSQHTLQAATSTSRYSSIVTAAQEGSSPSGNNAANNADHNDWSWA
ncbi:uncharacterized protein LOC119981316 [Tripterygium wilfordii]|uniref:uncharacterized protein LOC119981316 n=1 Tax=Tripterygium wilfordii TaxID=458696 RepID=UPI0018F814BA|nr:uncharacterized protein LOC119981316 [Tripterygium wilfordii]